MLKFLLNKSSFFILTLSLGFLIPAQSQDLLSPADNLQRESKFIDAQSRLITGSTEEALAIYKALLEENPNDDEAAFFLGKIYFEEKDLENSIKYLSLALANEKANPWYYLWTTDAYLQNKQIDQATKTMEDLIKQFPDEKQYYERLEYLYRDNQQYQKQLDLLNDMISRFGFHKTYELGRIQALSDLNQDQKAMELLEDLSESFPKDLFILNLLATFYQQKDNNDKAIQVFEKILEIDPGNSRANLAVIHSKSNDSDDDLLSLQTFFLNSKIDFDTKFGKIAHFFKGDLNDITQEEISQLMQVSDWLLQSHPDTPKALSLRADLLAQSGYNKEAAELYKQTVDLHPDNYLVWEQLLWSLKELDKWEEVSHYADEASIYFPNKASLYYMKGEAEFYLNNLDESIFDLQTAIDFSVDEPILESNALALMGMVYCAMEDKDSEKYFSLAKEALEDNPNIDYYMSVCFFDKGQIEEAGSHIDASLSKVPDHAKYAIQKTKILLLDQQYQKALDLLLPLADTTHYHAVFSYISQIYEQIGENDKASTFKQKAIEYGATE